MSAEFGAPVTVTAKDLFDRVPDAAWYSWDGTLNEFAAELRERDRQGQLPREGATGSPRSHAFPVARQRGVQGEILDVLYPKPRLVPSSARTDARDRQ